MTAHSSTEHIEVKKTQQLENTKVQNTQSGTKTRMSARSSTEHTEVENTAVRST
jgi:hypothetical protein